VFEGEVLMMVKIWKQKIDQLQAEIEVLQERFLNEPISSDHLESLCVKIDRKREAIGSISMAYLRCLKAEGL